MLKHADSRAAISLGIMEGSFDEAVSYAYGRFQGGRQIIQWPGVRMILTGMALHLIRDAYQAGTRLGMESLRKIDLVGGLTGK